MSASVHDVVRLARKYAALVAVDVGDDMGALVRCNGALPVNEFMGVESRFCDADKCLDLAFDYLFHNEKRMYVARVRAGLLSGARRCARLNGFFVGVGSSTTEGTESTERLEG